MIIILIIILKIITTIYHSPILKKKNVLSIASIKIKSHKCNIHDLLTIGLLLFIGCHIKYIISQYNDITFSAIMMPSPRKILVIVDK